MSDERNHKDRQATEISVNWEGLAKFFRWNGSINELKRARLDQPLEQTRRGGNEE